MPVSSTVFLSGYLSIYLSCLSVLLSCLTSICFLSVVFSDICFLSVVFPDIYLFPFCCLLWRQFFPFCYLVSSITSICFLSAICCLLCRLLFPFCCLLSSLTSGCFLSAIWCLLWLFVFCLYFEMKSWPINASYCVSHNARQPGMFFISWRFHERSWKG